MKYLLKHFADPAAGTVRLLHYAPRGAGGDTLTTDPAKFGQNKWTQAERRAEGTPKTFFYVDQKDKEGFFTNHDLYHTHYPTKHIYDATEDPDGHAERAHGVHDLVTKLRGMGYHGMFYSGVFPTVAMFKPVELHKTEEAAPAEPARLARVQAPANGAIANQAFHPGGQFLPRALRKIRDVAARLVRLARPLKGEPHGRLTGSPALAAEPVAADKAKGITLGELKRFEADLGVAQKDRLSPRATPHDPAKGDASTFSSKTQHVARFLDAAYRARKRGASLRSALSDSSASPNQKIMHAALHMKHEAREFVDHTDAGEWYGPHVDALEMALHKAHGIKPGSSRATLAKALVAATSGATKPHLNAMIVHYMLTEGARRNPKDPLLGVPAYNEPALRRWLAHPAHAGTSQSVLTSPGRTDVSPGTPPAAEHAWYLKHVLPKIAELDSVKSPVGYKSRPAVLVNAPGHPDHGRLVEYQHEGKDVLAPGGGQLFQRHRGKKRLRLVNLPVPDANGKLQPKGWNVRGAQVERGVERVQQLIRTLGHDKAAEWLLTEHSPAEFRKLFDYVPDEDEIDTDDSDKLPGMFILGPKFGAFGLNLHANHPAGAKYAKYLTADKWWSRTWNRFFGTLLKGAKRGQHVESPRKGERPLMIQAAKDATKAAGLKNVAELQAVLWYYEQSLWRMLGAKASSTSFLDGANQILKHKFPNDPARIRIDKGRAVWHGGAAATAPAGGGQDAPRG